MQLCLKGGVRVSIVSTILDPYKDKRTKDFTLEDAMQLFKKGFCCICEDGRISCLTNNLDLV